MGYKLSEKERRYQREWKQCWRNMNPEKSRDYQRNWKIKNWNRYKKYQKIWNENHREKHRLQMKAWRRDNNSRYRLWRRERYRKNPEYFREQTIKHKAKTIINGGSYCLVEWEKLIKKHNYCCVICDRQEPTIKLTVDHIIPLSKGGSNSIQNIQPLCKSCNSGKKDSLNYYGIAR